MIDGIINGSIDSDVLLWILAGVLGLTVLSISHELSVVMRSATNVLCLGHGRPCFGPPRTTMTPALLDALYGEPVGYHFHDPPR